MVNKYSLLLLLQLHDDIAQGFTRTAAISYLLSVLHLSYNHSRSLESSEM
jgi:hypothetical protein